MPLEIEEDNLDVVLKSVDSLGDNVLQIGWFENLKYDDDTPVAEVAATNEFGDPTENIPPRPFMRPAADNHQNEWLDLIEHFSGMVLDGEADMIDALEVLGLVASGDIRKAITEVHKPPLSWITIQNRLEVRADKTTIGKIDKPLIFEGILYNSVSYMINDDSVKSPYKTGGG